MRRLILLLAVAGCSPAPVPPAPVAILASVPAVDPRVAVVKKFDAATMREPAVVLGGDVTADRIERVRECDRHAREALTRLGRQGKHPTQAALATARQAVRALEGVLSQ